MFEEVVVTLINYTTTELYVLTGTIITGVFLNLVENKLKIVELSSVYT